MYHVVRSFITKKLPELLERSELTLASAADCLTSLQRSYQRCECKQKKPLKVLRGTHEGTVPLRESSELFGPKTPRGNPLLMTSLFLTLLLCSAHQQHHVGEEVKRRRPTGETPRGRKHRPRVTPASHVIILCVCVLGAGVRGGVQ